MVALSLYRGNLHRVPDVPRRWPMPPPAISLRHFKLLIGKRSLALSSLAAAEATSPAGTLDAKMEGKGRQEPTNDNVGAKPDSLKAETASNLNSQTPDSGQRKGGDMEEGKPLQESEGTSSPASNLPVGTAATSKDVRGLAAGGKGTAGAKLESANDLD
ncbi:hypothetical protein COCNU_14G012650 [Cocos nucifera]|uniref:Uncharacterized protein n=1 Tax=Cocos nucifera TaxID=13894 RepID=A0A8K0IW57_COCNU|nr:hypothetical protein COCNU_14G012650 [Cocos nucifera]